MLQLNYEIVWQYFLPIFRFNIKLHDSLHGSRYYPNRNTAIGSLESRRITIKQQHRRNQRQTRHTCCDLLALSFDVVYDLLLVFL